MGVKVGRPLGLWLKPHPANLRSLQKFEKANERVC